MRVAFPSFANRKGCKKSSCNSEYPPETQLIVFFYVQDWGTKNSRDYDERKLWEMHLLAVRAGESKKMRSQKKAID